MKRHRVWQTVTCWIVSGLVLTGCGARPATSSGGKSSGGSKARPSAQEKSSQAITPQEIEERYIASEAVGDYLPAILDGGRLKIAMPKGWDFYPRRKEFVARFHAGDPRALPHIWVTAEEAPDGVHTLTEANLRKFAAQIQAELETSGKLDDLVEREILLMEINDKFCVRHVVAAKRGRLRIECQVLETVAGGRLYTIELRVMPGTIEKHKLSAYAVLAGMQFLEPGADPDSEAAAVEAADGDDLGAIPQSPVAADK